MYSPKRLDRAPGAGRGQTLAAILLLLLLTAALIPPLLVGRHARASADDYSYGYATHQAVQAGEGLLPAVWRTVSGNYRTWQGSCSAMALMTLTPCIFSEGAYGLTAAAMLASVLLGTFLLLRTLIVRCAGGSWQDWICTACPLLLVALELLPSPCDSLYWWNGAVYYTFTFGLGLLYLERFVTLLWQGRGSWAVLVPGCLLGALVGGSNYVTGLLCLLLGGALLLGALCRRRAALPALTLLASLAVPFVVSMAAPGNRVRQAGLTGMAPGEAVLAAVGQGLADAGAWLNGPQLILCLALIPLLGRLAERSPLSFRLPGAAVLLSFLCFAAQNTPHFYAAAEAGPPRLRNIVFLSYGWLLLFNEWYLLGWIRRRLPWREAGRGRWIRPVGWGALAVLALCLLPRHMPAALTTEAVRELADGSAAAFSRERDSRLVQLLDPVQTDPRFSPIQTRPPLLFHSDITGDPAIWTNQALARFYGKATVALEEDG